MRSLLIRAFLVAALLAEAGPAAAASYQTVLGEIVDPIQSVFTGPHPYSGPDLAPFASAAGANLSFAVLEDADLYVADLRFANLTGSNLDGSNLDFVLLIDAVMVGTRLVDASLVSSTLAGADLTNAIIGRANLTNANLTGANLAGASLLQSGLSNANLTDANLTGASLRATSLGGATLDGATLDGAAYDELTIFPSGFRYESPPWDLDLAGTSPWDAGMIPVPEPSIAWMLVFGATGLAGWARWHPRPRTRTAARRG